MSLSQKASTRAAGDGGAFGGDLGPKKYISAILRLKRSATMGHAGWLRQTAMRGMAACSQMLSFAVARTMSYNQVTSLADKLDRSGERNG